jgi:hypothetical protein
VQVIFAPNLIVDGGMLDAQGYAGLYAGRGRPFETDVSDLVWSISMFRSGRAIINAINKRAGRKLTIVPYVGSQVNAFTRADHWLDAITAGQPSQNPRGPGAGTGLGSGALILFSPWINCYDRELYFLNRHRPIPWFQIRGLHPFAAGNDRGEVLVHEMVHAVTAMAGRETGQAAMQGGWDDEDEFRAIVITDIYSSERGRPLRQLHTAGVSLDNPRPWQSSPYVKRLIGSFITAMPDLVLELQTIDTAFNPLRGNFGLPDAQQRA